MMTIGPINSWFFVQYLGLFFKSSKCVNVILCILSIEMLLPLLHAVFSVTDQKVHNQSPII